MKRIGVMSDSHGILPKQVYTFFKDTDIILHAGDIGSTDVLQKLRAFKQTIAVYGNCDDKYMDDNVHGLITFDIEDVKVMMTHIGGYPGHYNKELERIFEERKPDLFICGHSHILKVVYDKKYKFLVVNPGACGMQGFHQVGTMVRFVIDGKQIKDMDVIDFDKFQR